MDRTYKIEITNSGTRRSKVCIEPWGDIFVIGKGKKLRISATGPEEGCLEIETAEDAIIVYGWQGSVVEGEIIAPDAATKRVPTEKPTKKKPAARTRIVPAISPVRAKPASNTR